MLGQTSLMPMNHNIRLSTATAFSFVISSKRLIYKSFTMSPDRFYCLCITSEIEMAIYTVKLQFLCYMENRNQWSSPWGGIVFPCLLVSKWFRVKNSQNMRQFKLKGAER